MYIVTEYCQNGDLLRILLDMDKTLGWRFRIKIALEAASALHYLHENNFIHRDIKSSNILLDQNWVCKISDFGMTREAGMTDAEAMRMTICGTDEYMAPELLFDEEYTKAVDVYSFGMVLLEILKRCKVGDGFAVRKPQNKFILDLDEVERMMPNDAPKSMVVLAKQCLGYEIISRPVTSDIKDWLQDLYDTTSPDVVPVPTTNPLPSSFVREHVITNTSPNSSSPVDEPGMTLSQKRRSLGQVRAFLWDNHGLHQDTLYDDKVCINLLLNPLLTHLLTYLLTHSQDAIMSGFLHKKTYHGFLKWKHIWFTLSNGKLWWRNSDRTQVKTIELQHAVIESYKNNLRFKISYKLNHEDDVYIDREFAAETATEKYKWVQAIENEISRLSRTERLSELMAAAPATANSMLNHKDMYSWLETLGLEQYNDNLEAVGYNIKMIIATGICDEELESFVGIKNKIHRSAILKTVGSGYSDSVRLVIKNWRDFGGVIVYTVVSRFKFNRSTMTFRYNDFKSLDVLLRKEISRNGFNIINKLPQLPGQGILQDTKVPSFIASRMAGLESYLLQLIHVLQDYSPVLAILIKFLCLDNGSGGLDIDEVL